MGGTSQGRYDRLLDRATLGGMAVGLGFVTIASFEGALEVGFFVTLIATVAQIVVGHLPRARMAAVARNSAGVATTPTTPSPTDRE